MDVLQKKIGWEDMKSNIVGKGFLLNVSMYSWIALYLLSNLSSIIAQNNHTLTLLLSISFINKLSLQGYFTISTTIAVKLVRGKAVLNLIKC